MSTITAGTATVSLTWDHAIVEKMIPGLEVALTNAAMRVAETARVSVGRDHGGMRSKPGGAFNSQSGHLSRSITHASPKQLGKPLTAAAGTNVFYGRVLEFGKTIRAKGGALVFPINKAAERFARTGNQGRHSAHMRGVLNALKFKYTGKRRLVWLPTKKGGVIIGVMDSGGKGGKGARFLLNEPMFLMVKRVTIAPRPWLRPALNKTDVAMIVGVSATREWRAKGLVK